MTRAGSNPGEPPPIGGDAPLPMFTFRGRKTEIAPRLVRSFAASQTSSLSSSEMHRLRAHNEIVTRSVGARLSLFLRTEFTIELQNLESLTLSRFCENAPPPRNLILFKIEPLRGIGLLDIPQPLGLAVADRMLGGKGFAVNPDRPLREIEIALINQMAQIAIREWASRWKNTEELRPVLLGRETNPKFLNVGPSDDIFYVLRMESGIADCVEDMQLLLPVKMLDPLVRQLSVETEAMKKEKTVREFGPPRWNAAYDDITVPLTAQWRKMEIMTRDLLNFKVGDVISIDPNMINDVEVRIGNIPKYLGRLGSSGSKSAVEITKTLAQ